MLKKCKGNAKLEKVCKSMSNLTAKDKEGRILVNGVFKVCNKPSNCRGSHCDWDCIINVMIRRLYELEHKKEK